MFLLRKIGSLIRGKASPFQIYAACLLGCLLGFTPGFEQSPALVMLWTLLLLVLNANLFLAGAVTLLSKLILLVGMPVFFSIGRFLLEGPTQGLFKAIVNAPVGAYSGFDYYVVAGGQFVALFAGLSLGIGLTRSLNQYRRKMLELSKNSERLSKYQSKGWAKTMKWVFFGSGRGKKSYEELMAVKLGNPIRIWGAALVALMVIGIVLGFRFVSGPFLTNLAKSELESANGATVDLEAVNLRLGESKLEIAGIAFADAQNLDTNVFEAERIVADVNTADLLRKRFSVDQLIVSGARSGVARESAGSLVGPKAKEGKPIQLPEFEDLGSVLENADVWKERLSQAKRWLEKLGSSEDPEGAEKEKRKSWEDQLNERIQAVGYAHVKADYLTEGSPTFWIRKFEALSVGTPYLDGAKLDVRGSDLSTHPALVPNPPTILVDSDNKRLTAKLSLAEASGTGENALSVKIDDYPVDSFAKSLKSQSGEPVLRGGTMTIDLGGRISILDNDLVAKVSFEDTMGRIGGNPVKLDGVTIPVMVKGPLDRPGVKLDPKALERVLVSVGKQKVREKVADELGLEGEKVDEAKQLLKGLFDRKKKE